MINCKYCNSPLLPDAMVGVDQTCDACWEALRTVERVLKYPLLTAEYLYRASDYLMRQHLKKPG